MTPDPTGRKIPSIQRKNAAGSLGEGPRVVAIGGGHGLAATLRAARSYASEVTAVVSVADDGGSSGRLRAALGIPAPGDLRRCLVALAEADDGLWARAFEHRFDSGELQGHALGNLVIAGLAATTGSFVAALAEAGRMVGATGRVLPATESPVVLKADSYDGEVEGQLAVSQHGRIQRVAVVPPDAPATPESVAAVEAADQIVLGPGSLYTSVLAALVVRDLGAAVAKARDKVVYVANLRPQEPETSGYGLDEHVAALRAHGIDPGAVIPPEGMSDASGVGHDPEALAVALRGLVR
ncbi:MAG TPA: uridine diphosphate-N-acetylglucosamine-binding protein YvcK [Acidimicrobiales bacterium]|nr:uridine diphosphate-N-acetylglucosamine-binding protein YvcK [Acidimicrobiales bacterium]